MKQFLRFLVAGVSALVLSGCVLVSTQAQPRVIPAGQVPFGLLHRTIPFTDNASVHFVNETVYLVNYRGALAPRHRLTPAPATLFEVLAAMAKGPTADEASLGYSTHWPTALTINQASLHHGLGYVDVSPRLAELSINDQRAAVAQLVFTARALGASKGVTITTNQQPYAVPLPGGRWGNVATPSSFAMYLAS